MLILFLVQKSFLKNLSSKNKINLIKYALLIEIRHFYTPPPPSPIHLTKKIRVNLKITNLDSGIKILLVES